MNRTEAAGAVLSVLGTAGYVLGVVYAYPGRAFSVTGLMTGVALLLIGRSIDPEGVAA